MFQQVHALWRRLSPLIHCSDGSVSVTFVAESASPVLQDDILLPLCPEAIVELLLLSPCRQKRSYSRSRTHLWLRQRGACPSSWSPAPSSRGWLQKRCLFTQGSMPSVEGLHLPCTYNQTEVEVQLHRFSTVVDVVNRVLWIRHTSYTRVDSENLSYCVVPSRSGRERLDL